MVEPVHGPEWTAGMLRMQCAVIMAKGEKLGTLAAGCHFADYSADNIGNPYPACEPESLMFAIGFLDGLEQKGAF